MFINGLLIPGAGSHLYLNAMKNNAGSESSLESIRILMLSSNLTFVSRWIILKSSSGSLIFLSSFMMCDLKLSKLSFVTASSSTSSSFSLVSIDVSWCMSAWQSSGWFMSKFETPLSGRILIISFSPNWSVIALSINESFLTQILLWLIFPIHSPLSSSSCISLIASRYFNWS